MLDFEMHGHYELDLRLSMGCHIKHERHAVFHDQIKHRENSRKHV